MQNYLRVINTCPANGFYNMALDEALFESLKHGGEPTLRFYTFSPPAITIGYLQSLSDIDINKCKAYGIDVVRRPTGGRAVIHNGDLTYSLVIPTTNPIFGGSLLGTYRKISLIFRLGLNTLGIESQLVRISKGHYEHNPLCFSSISRYELQVNGKKILGSAQRRDSEFVLQQGTIPINSVGVIHELPLLSVPVVGLSQIIGRDFKFEEIIEAIKNGIKAMGVKIVEGTLKSKEVELANKLLPKYKKL
ncbi:MAG: lipoate--protein ligase family protein [bacterium]|nr:lipoate--protein ligase family protein [bacterium]